jgi:hypothetical protein
MIDYCASFEAQEGYTSAIGWAARVSGLRRRVGNDCEKEQTIRGELIFACPCEQNGLRS